MSKPPLFDISSLKTVVQGAIGAMTFGAYHQFVTNKIMELNNDKMEKQHKSDLAILDMKNKNDLAMLEMKNKTDLSIQELKHKEEMKNFQEKLEAMEAKITSKSSWW
jgi:hypothetical protein